MNAFRVLLLALTSLSLACSSTPTQTIVQINLDGTLLSDGEAEVEIELVGNDGRRESRRNIVRSPNLPLCVSVVPEGGDSNRSFQVTARVLRGGTAIAESRHIGTFSDGELQVLPMNLQNGCLHQSCDAGQTCGLSGCGTPETVTEYSAHTNTTCGAEQAVDGGQTDPEDAGPGDAGTADGGIEDAFVPPDAYRCEDHCMAPRVCDDEGICRGPELIWSEELTHDPSALFIGDEVLLPADFQSSYQLGDATLSTANAAIAMPRLNMETGELASTPIDLIEFRDGDLEYAHVDDDGFCLLGETNGTNTLNYRGETIATVGRTSFGHYSCFTSDGTFVSSREIPMNTTFIPFRAQGRRLFLVENPMEQNIEAAPGVGSRALRMVISADRPESPVLIELGDATDAAFDDSAVHGDETGMSLAIGFRETWLVDGDRYDADGRDVLLIRMNITGEVAWTVHLTGIGAVDPGVIGRTGDNVIIGTSPRGPFRVNSNPSQDFGDGAGWLASFDVTTGSIRWQRRLDDQAVTHVSVSDERIIISAGTWDFEAGVLTTRIFEPQNDALGEELWSLEIRDCLGVGLLNGSTLLIGGRSDPDGDFDFVPRPRLLSVFVAGLRLH